MIAGYLTATSVDLARVKELNGDIHLSDKRTFANRDFSDFGSILGLYLKKIRGEAESLVMGVAGPVIDNRVKTTNLPWTISGSSIESKFDLQRVRIVNDLVAAAHGLFFLKDDKFYTLNKGLSQRQGNIGLIAAGTGLGEAIITYDGVRYRPYASEGGHAGFTPANQLEVELWEYIYGSQGSVEVEDVVSLPGLERIYRFMVERNRAVISDWFKKSRDKPDAIIEQALSGSDEIAVKTLNLFIDAYAGEVTNLALKGMTLGGIHLVGQIAPRILTLLDDGRLVRRFKRKGKMESLLAGIPIKVVLDSKAALLGAAAMAISQKG
jgi:glucokinase